MTRPAIDRRQAVQSPLHKLVFDNRMNDPAGDIAHHFALAKTVKTIYVNRRQHRGLIAGTLGIVVLDQRHHLVPLPVALAVRQMDPAVPVIVGEPSGVSDGVPDDLIW